MDNDRNDEILEKLGSIERRLDDISQRVSKLESAGPAPVQQAVTPPPVVREAYFAPQYQQEPRIRPAYEPPPYKPPPPPTTPRPGLLDGSLKVQQGNSAEYVIGAKILPKVGAILMLLGITFAVVLAYRRGFITPAMM